MNIIVITNISLITSININITLIITYDCFYYIHSLLCLSNSSLNNSIQKQRLRNS
jgi:hypothetical protein